MTLGNHVPEDDLVLFALQLLPEDRMRQARQHTEGCDLCRSEIAKLQGDLVAYSMTADIVAPPPEARDRFLRQVAKEPRPILPPDPVPEPEPEPSAPMVRPDPVDRFGRVDAGERIELPTRRRSDRAEPTERPSSEPVFATRQRRGFQVEAAEEDEPEKPRRPSRMPWVLAWTGWAVAAGCSFVAGLQFHQRQQIQSTIAAQQARLDDVTKQSAHAQEALATLTAANSMQMPLHSTVDVKPGTQTASAIAAYQADKGALIFIAMHMDPAPIGKTYELWLMPADGRNAMPVTTFKPDAQGNASVVMPQLPKGIPAKSFGVTLENEGGSDTPTLPVLLAGS